MSKLNLTVGVSGGNLTKKHVLNVVMDFTGIEQSVILGWAADSRVIALQRVLRATDDAHLDKLSKIPLEIHASACGAKIETPAERVAKLVAAGMPAKLAELAVANPTKFAEMMAGLK